MPTNNKPIHFLDPDSKTNGTRYRSVLCDSNTVYLDVTQKKISQKRRQNAIDDTIRLRSDFKACDQSYYTTDKNRVTCKNCKLKLAGKTRNGPFLDLLWEARFVGDKKSGGWVVLGDGIVRRLLPGVGRKIQDAALDIVRKHNTQIRLEARMK